MKLKDLKADKARWVQDNPPVKQISDTLFVIDARGMSLDEVSDLARKLLGKGRIELYDGETGNRWEQPEDAEHSGVVIAERPNRRHNVVMSDHRARALASKFIDDLE